MKSNKNSDELKKATFAGGCFWCMESPFDKLTGVYSTTSGYTAGQTKDPTYKEICSGRTGHAEAIEIAYDPEVVSYNELLDVFWRNINPLALNRQFADVGTQYRTAIYYHDENQKKTAEESRDKLQKSGKFNQPIVTEISPASEFYNAEEYHQDYYKKNPLHYKLYRQGSGRDAYLKSVWGNE